MCPVSNVKGRQFFRYQNVHNWHLLCDRDPVAMAIYQDKVNGRNQDDTINEAIERHSRVAGISTSIPVEPAVMSPHVVSVVGGDNSSIVKSKMGASIQPKRVPLTNETPAIAGIPKCVPLTNETPAFAGIGIPIVTTLTCVKKKLVEIANDKSPDCYETPLLADRTTYLSVKGCDDIVNFDKVKTHQGVAAAAAAYTSNLAAGDTISDMTNGSATIQTEVSSLCFLTALLVLYCSQTNVRLLYPCS
jgi:hypothetical protein